jgi:dTDP-4-amino-4,6-dideoxygalactose transaminase
VIVMNNFKSEPIELKEAMLVAARRVIESGWYVLGQEVLNFEEKWAKVCGVKYGVGVGNGMDAIEISLRALNIGPGDEVITTSMTAFATVLAIIRTGATPVLADIEYDSALLSIASVKRCFTERTKAVLLVHLYGQMRSMGIWYEFCRSNEIYLLEDCAQAHLASWKGKVAGSFGVAGAYSFYPTKNLGAPGDAGMLVTNDYEMAEKAFRFRNYGQSVRYHHPELGMNSRLDEIQAAILSERMRWLNEFTERRKYIASIYQNGIKNSLIRQLARPNEPDAHVYHLYVITCSLRDSLQRHLNYHGIQSLIHYPIPIHNQEPCLTFKRDPEGLLCSENHANECISLPCHPQMEDEEIMQVIDAVNSFRG